MTNSKSCKKDQKIKQYLCGKDIGVHQILIMLIDLAWELDGKINTTFMSVR